MLATQTNVIPVITNNEVGPVLNKLAQWNDQLMDAPINVVILLFLIAGGVHMRKSHRFNNDMIPIWLAIVGIPAYVCPNLEDMPRESFITAFSWLSKSVLYGVIIATGAWIASIFCYKWIIKRFGNGNKEEDNSNPVAFRRPEQKDK